ncbi:MAG: RHS repeat-associated core domain-containing protein, partial [Acidobacteriota bacterium]|nr:RHS repeat-associated core domain-containing protein [Acidobacteriota bacterium]
VGGAATMYGFTGEPQSGGLVYLRARYYASGTGRFLTKDAWEGDANRPLSFNKWLYAHANPINLTDPTGFDPCTGIPGTYQPDCGVNNSSDSLAPVAPPPTSSNPPIWIEPGFDGCYDDFGGWKPYYGLSEDAIRISPEDIRMKGGLLQYLRSESDAMILTRISMAEALAAPADRENVMWIIKIRAEYGYSNGKRRHKGDPIIRWGDKTDIRTEGVNTSQFESVGKVVDSYERLRDQFNPAGFGGGTNLRAMLHPTDAQLAQFRATYQTALRVVATSVTSAPAKIKGYDTFFATTTVWQPNYPTGLKPTRFEANGNVFKDLFPGDNISLGLISCQEVMRKAGAYALSVDANGQPTSRVKDFICPPGY